MDKKPTYRKTKKKDREPSEKAMKRSPFQGQLGEGNGPLFSLVEAIPDAVFLKDSEGRHLFVNQACEELIGLKEEEIVGKTDEQILPPDLAEHCVRSDREAIKTRRPVRFKKEMTDAQGKKSVLEIIKVPFLDDQGDVAGLVGIRRDITERSRVEESLIASEEKYRLLVETMNDGLGIRDEHGRITYVNDRLCQMWGYSEKEIIGRRVGDFLDETSLALFQEQITKRKTGEKGLYEVVVRKKDGENIFSRFSASPIFDEEGKYRGSFAVVTDITQLKRVENELRTRESELSAQSNRLQEVNTALKVLVKDREEDKNRLEKNVLSHVKQLVSPYLGRLKNTRLNSDQEILVSVLEENLNNIISPMAGHLSSKYQELTPTEIRVADLVRDGKRNEEIAELLNISKNTVKFHRFNLRTKLGLKNKKINLRAYLMSLT